jgi:hypothetical protein
MTCWGEIVGRIFDAGVSVARPWMWTLDVGHHEHRRPDPRLCGDPRGRHGCIRQELAGGMKESPGVPGGFKVMRKHLEEMP